MQKYKIFKIFETNLSEPVQDNDSDILSINMYENKDIISILKKENYRCKCENQRLMEENTSLKMKLEKSLSKIQHQDDNITRFKDKSKQILETSEKLEQTCLKQKDDIEFYKKEIEKVINSNSELNIELDSVYNDLNHYKDLLKKTEGHYEFNNMYYFKLKILFSNQY